MTTCSPRALRSRAFCDIRIIAPSSEWLARCARRELASKGAMAVLCHALLVASSAGGHYGAMMNRDILSVAALLLLASCAGPSRVAVTSSPGAAVQTAARSEPIFYNGHHYQVNFTYND